MEMQLPLDLKGGAANLDLLDRFRNLSVGSIEAHDKFIRAEDAIWKVLAEGYLLWLDLHQQSATLDKIYAQHGFQPASAGQNELDFAPYVKALFRLDLPEHSRTAGDRERALSYGAQRNKSSRYVAVLTSIYEEFGDRQGDLKFGAVMKASQFIEERGGVKGFVEARADQNHAAKLQQKGLTPVMQAENDIEEARKWIESGAVPFLRTAPSIAWQPALTPAAVAWDGDHALVALRRTAGRILYGPTSHDPAALGALAIAERGKLTGINDISLRLLAEVVACQSYPAKFAPAGSRADLKGKAGEWVSDVLMEPGTMSGGLPAPRRLVVRQQDILLSTMLTDASVVKVSLFINL
jgi:hypothetical protein